MTCDEIGKQNNNFINGKINDKQLIEYIKHVECCKECYEELDITYIVTMGLDGINSDTISDFNLKGSLARRIEEAKMYLKVVMIRRKIFLSVGTLANGLLIIIVLMYFNNLF